MCFEIGGSPPIPEFELTSETEPAFWSNLCNFFL